MKMYLVKVEFLRESGRIPLELVFGDNGREIISNELIVVCVDETDNDFILVLEMLIKRLYREKVGEKPDSNRFSDTKELVKETRWVSAEDKVFIVKIDEEDWNKLIVGGLKDDWNRILSNRVLNELYTEDFGAIIFNRFPTEFLSGEKE